VLLAWRWEGLGGGVAIISILGRTIAFDILRGAWHVQAIPVIAFGVPAILFLTCWARSQAGHGSSDAIGR
jgi:hypothetical protein